MTGTNLITKKHVLQYQTTQGMRYRIKKEHAQSSQRDLRNERRTQQKVTSSKNENVVSHTPSPFIQLMATKTPLDDTSSDDSSHQSSIKDQPPATPHGVEESKDDPNEPAPVPTSEEKSTFQSELTEHAAALEKTMESAMADLTDPEPTHDTTALNVQLETLIEQTVQRNLTSTLQRLEQTEMKLSTIVDKHNQLQMEHENLQKNYDNLQLQYDRLNRQVNFNSRALENTDERLSKVEHSTKEISTKVSDIEKTMPSRIEEIINNIDLRPNANNDNLKTVAETQDKFKRRLTRLKEGTLTMFKDMEADYDMLTDRIHRVETDINNLKTPNVQKSTARKLEFDKSSESDDSSFSLAHKNINLNNT